MEGKKALADRGVEYFWEMVMNYKPEDKEWIIKLQLFRKIIFQK